jgi:glycerophosphoryl diester phosphodiesterase
MNNFFHHWPYPFWIAHRGAGKLAPENTLAAFRLGAQFGYRMFECDVKLSSDDVIFLLHDAQLERTTNGQGTAGDLTWSELARLDAGQWHSRAFTGEPLPTLEALAKFCMAGGYFLNIEIKPTPGLERHTGEVVAAQVRQLWSKEAIPPLLTSFEPLVLEAAYKVAPELPRGLLLNSWQKDAVSLAQTLQCQAMVCYYEIWNEERVGAVHQAGFKALSYTVNDSKAALHLLQLATDGIITDRVDLFNEATFPLQQ